MADDPRSRGGETWHRDVPTRARSARGSGQKPRFLPATPDRGRSPVSGYNMGWKTGFEPATLGITIRCSNRLSYIHHIFALLARPEGVEPPTDGVEVRCSIQLSYGRPTPDCAPGGHARHHATLLKLVGVEGFEPPTSCSQSRRATRLRYTPMHRNDGLRQRTDAKAAASGGAQSSMAARGRRHAAGTPESAACRAQVQRKLGGSERWMAVAAIAAWPKATSIWLITLTTSPMA